MPFSSNPICQRLIIDAVSSDFFFLKASLEPLEVGHIIVVPKDGEKRFSDLSFVAKKDLFITLFEFVKIIRKSSLNAAQYRVFFHTDPTDKNFQVHIVPSFYEGRTTYNAEVFSSEIDKFKVAAFSDSEICEIIDGIDEAAKSPIEDCLVVLDNLDRKGLITLFASKPLLCNHTITGPLTKTQSVNDIYDLSSKLKQFFTKKAPAMV